MTSISRRRFLHTAAGTASALQLAHAARAFGLAAPDVCTLAAEQEVGPYYVSNEMIRQDIRESKVGFPLMLELAVMDSRTCKPLAHAAVDVWHCDALGLYSGYTSMNPTGDGPGGPGGPPPGFDPSHPERRPPPPGASSFDPNHPDRPNGPPESAGRGGFQPPAPKPTDKLTFLRGVQVTDAQGRVRFQTVFPGFYMGRTNHIHFKVRLGGHTGMADSHHTYLAGHTSHTGQVFFPEEVTVNLMKREPYATHKIHRTTDKEDGIFTDQHGNLFLSRLQFMKPGTPEAGLRAELAVAVDPTATPKPAERGGPGAPPRS